MSFLHGVLESVKDDDSVTTYDNNELNNINTVITNLHNVGKGREAFREGVAKVSEWLKKHGEQVEGKTKKVSERVHRLLSLICRHSKTAEDKKGDKLQDQLESWSSTLNTLDKHISDTEKQHINLLDSTLKTNIMHEIEPVKATLAVLKDSAVNGFFQRQVAYVDKTLVEEKDGLLEKVREESDKLQKTLDSKLGEIYDKICEIGNERTKQLVPLLGLVEQLVDTVGQADVAAKALVSEYQSKIVDQLGTINEQTDALSTAEIDTGIQQIVYRVSEQLDILATKLPELQSTHREVEGQVDRGLENIRSQLQQQISALKDEIKKNVKEYFTDYVRKVRQQVRDIGDKVGERSTIGTGDSVYYNWHQLQQQVTRLVGDINGKSGETGKPNYKGLKGIKQRVLAYAMKFKEGQDGFEKLIEQWIEDIWGNNSEVRYWLVEYVNVDGNKGKVDGAYIPASIDGMKLEKAETIAGIIKGQIKSVLDASGAKAASAIEHNGITENVNYVRGICGTFAQKLGEELEKSITKRNINIGQLAKTINAKVKKGGEEPKYTLNLQRAVYATLTALQAKARQTANVLKSFSTAKDDSKTITFNFGFNLEAAIKNVASIETRFGNSVGSDDQPGRKITEALQLVTTKIEQLQNNLGTAATPSAAISEPLKVNVTDSVEKRIDEKIAAQEVNKQLGELLKEAVINGIGRLNVRVTKIHSQLKGVEPAIQTHIDKLNKKPVASSDNIPAQIYVLQQKISQLTALVSNTKVQAEGGIKGQVTSVQRRVADILVDVNKIKDDIIAFNSSLQQSIQEAKSTHQQCKEALTQAITSLHDELTKTVKEIFQKLTHQVQAMFANDKVAQLAALTTLVTSKKSIIEDIIKKDKESGIKGLLNKMNTSHTIVAPIEDEKELRDAAQRLNAWYKTFWTYVSGQIANHPSKDKASKVNEALTDLLQKMIKENHFSHEVSENIKQAAQAAETFTPSKFTDDANPLLQVLKESVKGFTSQVNMAYVSKYSGQSVAWDILKPEDRDMYAQAFLSCVPMLNRDLWELKYQCNHDWKYDKINSITKLGDFFQSSGFEVSKLATSQDGVLRNHEDKRGYQCIYGINKLFPIKDSDILRTLFKNLQRYYAVCHHKLPSSPKHPSSVRDMLAWTAGLPYTGVFRKIEEHCDKLLDLKDSYGIPNKDYPVMRECIGGLYSNIEATCSLSASLLVAICGNGRGAVNADYPYSVHFSNNHHNFHYPSDAASLLSMFYDIVRRAMALQASYRMM
ncbi:hypothetical protein, conserved [Babesia ovata]|uniref:Extracellular matrix-binding ebh n=1 Tax=Babesia ovata TaxID=189622 RepID=A0A2H6KJY8_9APIC|nr:uncharacterized protein BOVATA_048060 [Babesia ovata]GBE63313.1 hypothetical protein, conserved [Babesia ovata]